MGTYEYLNRETKKKACITTAADAFLMQDLEDSWLQQPRQ
jgi:hypothetical protein